MLSVTQSAELLDITPTRVRALIKSGKLAAVKSGGIWILREEDVLKRLSDHPRLGRPARAECPVSQIGGSRQPVTTNLDEAHAVYQTCRRLFNTLPSREMMSHASSKEEASFYMAVSDFFLQQKQRKLISQGVF